MRNFTRKQWAAFALFCSLWAGLGFMWFQADSITGDMSASSYNRLARIMVDRAGTWSAALAACPAAGCILDATGPNAPRAMGSFDVGSKVVRVEFGPFSNFTADHIVLRAGLWLQGISGETNGTVIQSVGANAQNLIVFPQTNTTQAFNFKIDSIRFLGAAGNTSQEGLSVDLSTLTGSAFEYGELTNLWFLNFVGTSIHLKGRPLDANSANQFLQFRNVSAFRPSGSNPVLKIEGYAGQSHFDSVEFDGAAIGDGTNIYLGSGGGTNTQTPNTIFFDNLTSQNGTVAINCDGCQAVDIRGLHDENTYGSILVSNTSAGINVTANPLIHIHDSAFAANVGVNGGNGFIVNITDTASPKVVLENNFFGGNPDNVIKCANTNSCDVHTRNNFMIVSGAGAAPSVNITPVQAPAATMDIHCWSHVVLTTSVTNITTLKGCHLPGETVTFVAFGGTSQFATGGNLSLGSNVSPLVVKSGDSVTFTRVDSAGTWVLSAYSPGGGNVSPVGTTLLTAVSGTGNTAALAAGANLTGFTIGSGSTLNLYKVATDTPGAITVNANTCTDRSVAVAGLLTSATIVPTAAYALDANIIPGPGQAAAGSAHYRLCNLTGANITLNAAAAFNLAAWQ